MLLATFTCTAGDIVEATGEPVDWLSPATAIAAGAVVVAAFLAGRWSAPSPETPPAAECEPWLVISDAGAVPTEPPLKAERK